MAPVWLVDFAVRFAWALLERAAAAYARVGGRRGRRFHDAVAGKREASRKARARRRGR